ncbi:hypothetical protein RhiirC2_842359 [Rhizophagus irregularis]|uniref:Uncharacterized protein n=1 Tax=Rhizophagus irregularis TaxID=588596 RepID=A0A2N1P0R5_9GLOM|nr:hypothetical protein RhiirC2_842359 [Rhizophagus irregularis]
MFSNVSNGGQGAKISEGRYETTCAYCNYFWKEGSHKDLEAHCANECSEIPANTRQFFLNCLAAKAEGNITINLEHLEQLKIHEIDRACVKAFAVCGIAWHVIENPFFIKFLKTLRPGYTPPSKEVLSGKLLSQESAAYHSQLNKKKKVSALKEEAKTCDISDGGLKKWVDTRWHTMYDCVDSIMRHKTLLENQYYQSDILPKDEHDEIDSDLEVQDLIDKLDLENPLAADEFVQYDNSELTAEMIPVEEILKAVLLAIIKRMKLKN